MITLYGSLRSRTLRPLWLLREAGLAHEMITTIQAYRITEPDAADAPFNTHDPRFISLNPMGQVPVMTDGSLVLTESVAITLYLAQKAGGPLAAATPQEEGQLWQWAMLGVSAIEKPALDILMAYHQGDPTSAAGQAVLTEARALLARPCERLEAHLTSQDWLMGGRFTVADLILAEILRFAIDDSPLFTDLPQTKAWLTRARTRPAYQTLWAERNAEPILFPS